MNAATPKSAILTADAARALPPGAQAMGSHQGRVWAHIGWADAAGLDARTAAGWNLAFLEESEYLATTVGFTGAQLAVVMEKRAGDHGQALSDFADDLGETAGMVSAWGLRKGGAWERNAAKLFSLHREAFFTGRFVLGTHEDLSQLIRWRAGLAAFEKELASRKDCPPAWAPVFAGLDAKPVLDLLAQAAAHLGQPAYTQAPVRDSLLRIAFTAGSPEIAERIARTELVAEPWAGAYLIALTGAEIRDLQVLGAETVYPTAEEYQRSLVRLTRDQRKAEIDGRIAAGLQAKEWYSAILHLRLTFLAYLEGHREEEAASSKADPANLARLAAVFSAETDALARMVHLAWGEPAERPYLDRIADIKLQARILAGFSGRAGESDVADLMSLFGKTLAALEPV